MQFRTVLALNRPSFAIERFSQLLLGVAKKQMKLPAAFLGKSICYLLL
jgi:hypothetical protein